MIIIDAVTLALCRRYVNDSLIGIGALKGAPCEVDSISKTDLTTTITLKWTDTTGTDHFDSFDIEDGVGITGASIDDNGNLKILLTDGTEIDCGKVNSQFTTLPTPSASNVGAVLQYVGSTTSLYTKGYFYECVLDGSVYKWEQIDVQEGGGGPVQPAKMLVGTMLAANWVGNTQTVTVNGVDASTNGVIGLLNSATDTEIADARKALLTVTSVRTNTVTFKCEKVPAGDISFGILIPGGGSGGGGSAELMNDLTASLTVGGIRSGEHYPAGTSLETILNNLLNPVMFPTLTNPSASISGGTTLIEKGATESRTITVSFNRGSINPAYGTSGYRSGAAIDYSLNGGTAQSGNTFPLTITESNKTFKGKVNYSAGEQPKDSKGNNYSSPLPAGYVETSTLTYEFVEAIWANTADITTIAKTALVSKSAKQKDLVFPAQTVANPEVFDIPDSWTVTAIQVKNDLTGSWDDCSAEFTQSSETHPDASGAAVNYTRYTFNLGYDTGSRQIRVKWS